jgi:hypothetical protein
MGTDALLERHINERNTKETLINTYAETAATEDRDLNENEVQTITAARSRIKELDDQIELLADNLAIADSVRDKIRIASPETKATFQYRAAGDLVWDMLHQDDDSARARYGRFTKPYVGTRAAEHMGWDKANTVPVAGGFNGLIVAPVVGPTLDPSPQGRPLFTAIGATPVTTAAFMRPRIVDPNFATGVAPQGQEKAELVSKAWDILSDRVELEVIGGYINVSMLLEEMLAGSLDQVVAHMNRRLEYVTEVAAVTEMKKTTANIPLAADADAAAIQKAIADAAALVGKNTGRLPEWIAMGIDGWARLMALTDSAGRPLFPAIGPSNALGIGGADSFIPSVMGLRAIVTFAITDGAYFVGNSFGLEIYERRLSLMTVLEPSLRGRQVSVASAVGFFRPVTKEATQTPTPAESNGIVRIGP